MDRSVLLKKYFFNGLIKVVHPDFFINNLKAQKVNSSSLQQIQPFVESIRAKLNLNDIRNISIDTKTPFYLRPIGTIKCKDYNAPECMPSFIDVVPQIRNLQIDDQLYLDAFLLRLLRFCDHIGISVDKNDHSWCKDTVGGYLTQIPISRNTPPKSMRQDHADIERIRKTRLVRRVAFENGLKDLVNETVASSNSKLHAVKERLAWIQTNMMIYFDPCLDQYQRLHFLTKLASVYTLLKPESWAHLPVMVKDSDYADEFGWSEQDDELKGFIKVDHNFRVREFEQYLNENLKRIEREYRQQFT
jgi:hypothetical protein